MLKFFTDKDTQQSVAVNPDSIRVVCDLGIGPKIVFIDSSYLVVTEPFLEVVARLNERSN